MASRATANNCVCRGRGECPLHVDPIRSSHFGNHSAFPPNGPCLWLSISVESKDKAASASFLDVPPFRF